MANQLHKLSALEVKHPHAHETYVEALARHRAKRKEGLPPEVMLNDGGGLYLRVRPTGSSWVFVYGPRQARRKASPVPGPMLSLADARTWASEQRDLVKSGKADPQHAMRAERKQVDGLAAKTLQALMDAYVEDLRDNGSISAKHIAHALKLHVPKALCALPARQVQRADFVHLFKGMIDRGIRPMTQKVYASMRAAFQRAIDSEDGVSEKIGARMQGFGITHNPLAGIKGIYGDRKGDADAELASPRERALRGDHHLELDELQAFLEVLGDCPADHPARDAAHLLRLCVVLGGQRVQQMARARVEWKDGHPLAVIDDRKKQGKVRAHVVPLDGLAREVFDERGGALFGCDAEDAALLAQYATDLVREVYEPLAAAGLVRHYFCMRNLRASAHTLMSELEVPRDVKNQVQSNNIRGVDTKHYDKFKYVPQKRVALAQLQSYLAGYTIRPVGANAIPAHVRAAVLPAAEVIELAPRRAAARAKAPAAAPKRRTAR